jgi:hypothetical protein
MTDEATSGDQIPIIDNTYDLGRPTKRFRNGSFAGSVSAATITASGQMTATDRGSITGLVMVDQSAGTATQSGNIATEVILNKRAGIITLATTIPGAQQASFTFTNSYITTSSIILAWTTNTTTVTSLLQCTVSVSGITSGSCTINVANPHGTNATAAAPKVQFIVI